MRRKARCRWASARRRSSDSSPGDAERAVEVRARAFDVAGGRLQPSGQEQTGRLLLWRGETGGRGERATDPRGSGDAVAEHHPRPAESVGDADAEARGVFGGPGEGGVDVGAVGANGGHARGLGVAAYGRGASIGGFGEPRRVCRGRVVGAAGFPQAQLGEGADAVEQPVAYGPVGPDFGIDQRSVDESADDVEHGCRGDAERTEDVFRGGERCAAGEARQGPQSTLVVGEQQLVAPPDRRGQRAAAFGATAGRVAEQRETVVESPRDLLYRQGLDPGGGELDGQRQPVEGSADRLDDGGGLLVEHEPGAQLCGAGGEQRDRVGDRERFEGIDGLAVEPQRKLAGGEDAQVRGGVQQAGGQVGHGVDDVFAVVEHEDGLGAGDAVEEHLFTAGEVQRLGHGLGYRRGGGGRVESDEPDAVGGIQVAGHLDGGAGLADTGRSDQRHQPPVTEQPIAGGDLVGPPDQRCRERGQVADRERWRGGPVDGAAEGGTVPQDLAFESAEVRSRFDAELLDQYVPHPGVRRQRIGLPAGPVERGDQRDPQSFAQRVPVDESFQLADHVAAGAEVDACGEVVLDQAEADLVQPHPVGVQPVAVAGVDEDLAPEQRQPFAGDVHGGRRVAGPPRRGRGRGQGEDVQGVDAGLVHVQGVAAVAARDQVGATQRPPELGHLRLHRVLARAGGRGAPQVVDQPVGAHQPSGIERQPDEHLRGLAGRHREVARRRGGPRAGRARATVNIVASVCLVPTAGPDRSSDRRQRVVSTRGHSQRMPDDIDKPDPPADRRRRTKPPPRSSTGPRRAPPRSCSSPRRCSPTTPATCSPGRPTTPRPPGTASSSPSPRRTSTATPTASTPSSVTTSPTTPDNLLVAWIAASRTRPNAHHQPQLGAPP